MRAFLSLLLLALLTACGGSQCWVHPAGLEEVDLREVVASCQGQAEQQLIALPEGGEVLPELLVAHEDRFQDCMEAKGWSSGSPTGKGWQVLGMEFKFRGLGLFLCNEF